MKSILFALGVGLALGGTAMAEPTKVLTPERVFSSPDLSGPVARGVQLSPDGKLVTFLKSKPGDQTALDLWAAPTSGDSPMPSDSSPSPPAGPTWLTRVACSRALRVAWPAGGGMP